MYRLIVFVTSSAIRVFPVHSSCTALMEPRLRPHRFRLVIPQGCCDATAPIRIATFGGEQKTKEIAGGTRSWQVRGVADGKLCRQ